MRWNIFFEDLRPLCEQLLTKLWRKPRRFGREGPHLRLEFSGAWLKQVIANWGFERGFWSVLGNDVLSWIDEYLSRDSALSGAAARR